MCLYIGILYTYVFVYSYILLLFLSYHFNINKLYSAKILYYSTKCPSIMRNLAFLIIYYLKC